jgi:hypothetical protein
LGICPVPSLITIGEGTGQIPKGTHDWNKFLTPDGEVEMGSVSKSWGGMAKAAAHLHVTQSAVSKALAELEVRAVRALALDRPILVGIDGHLYRDGGRMLHEAMVLLCMVKLKYLSTTKDITYLVNFEIFGDGKITPSMLAGKVQVS